MLSQGLAQEALTAVRALWGSEGDGDDDAGDELHGKDLSRAATAAWTAMGERRQAAEELARLTRSAAEALHLAPSLTFGRFHTLFSRMAAVRAAAGASRLAHSRWENEREG